MGKLGKARTMSEGITGQLRDEILDGRWRPGQQLQLTQIAERYATSTTVVREALLRLNGERLVRLRPNRGFFVSELSLGELSDLTEYRTVTEQLGVRLSVARGDLSWESKLIAAHHTMSRTAIRDPANSRHLSSEWVAAHRTFHAILIEACNLEVLTETAASLADMTELYRRWSVPAVEQEDRDVLAEDTAILEAALDRDAERTAELIRRHYDITLQIILAAGLALDAVAGSGE